MKTKWTIMALVASLFTCRATFAQSDEEGKIVVEIDHTIELLEILQLEE